jgi:hypothetical protein
MEPYFYGYISEKIKLFPSNYKKLFPSNYTEIC